MSWLHLHVASRRWQHILKVWEGHTKLEKSISFNFFIFLLDGLFCWVVDATWMSGVEIHHSALHQVWLRANQVYDIMVFGTVESWLECRKHGAGAGGRSQASVHLFHTSASCSGLLVIVLQTLLQRVDSFLKELEALLFLPAQKVQSIVLLLGPRGRGNYLWFICWTFTHFTWCSFKWELFVYSFFLSLDLYLMLIGLFFPCQS